MSLEELASGGIATNVKLTRLEPSTLGIKAFYDGRHSMLVITVNYKLQANLSIHAGHPNNTNNRHLSIC